MAQLLKLTSDWGIRSVLTLLNFLFFSTTIFRTIQDRPPKTKKSAPLRFIAAGRLKRIRSQFTSSWKPSWWSSS
jgi:hypothetical protein